MLKEMKQVQEMIKNLEQKYDIDIIRIYHEQNQIQLIGTKGFGKLPVKDIAVTRRYTEEYDCFTGIFDGTKFLYLLEREGINDNN